MSESQGRHLDECLSSVHAQAATRTEVVLAPWGQWDGAPPPGALPPAESLAAARLAGLAATATPYIRFLEATDTVPADSTRVLLEALHEAPCASAAGVSERIDATWRDRAHAVAPEAALELGARLFHLTDGSRHRLAFDPDHGRWADATLADLDAAGAPEVVTDVVHHDHHREHGLAFGHLPRRADDVRTLASAVEAAVDEVDPRLAATWAAGVLDRRLPSLVEDVESYDDGTWTALRRTTDAMLRLADPTEVRVEARLQAWLVSGDRRGDLTALVLRRWREPDDMATTITPGGEVLADLGVPAPPEVRMLHERETPLWAKVRRAQPEGHTWTVDLVVLARGVPSTSGDRVTLHSRGRVIEAEPSGDERADRIAAESWTDHRTSGWRLRVAVADLAGGAELEYRSGPVVRRGPLPELTSPSSARREAGPRLLGVRWAGETATLTLSTPGRVAVTGPGGEVSGATDQDGTVALLLTVDPWGLGDRPLPLGAYEVRLDDRAVLLGADLARGPVEHVGDRHRLVVRVGANGTAGLVLEDLRGPDEVGPGAQRRLRQEYAVSTAPVDPTLAYFQAYTGQQATDSPLVIHESLRRRLPDVRIRWCVDDPGVPVPEGAEPVLIRSREWYDTLAGAHWIVTNIEMERWFRRRPGQELLQTWHGNPGKVMGLSLWRANGLTPGRIKQNLDHGPRNWTLLMSPSPEMTVHYRREFAYDGPAVDQGYARDDPLVAPGAAQLRADARRRLGIGADQSAVLYAPTWRDTLATNYRAARPQDDLDLGRLAADLGPTYVVLLRGHRFHARHPGLAGGARVLDVTAYPEINDLILAADVAVLDYSSLRFDVGVVGTPMVFMVPDLAAYEQERGFLFDFRSSAPGPLLSSTGEVLTALRDLDGLRVTHAEEYAEFRARFHPGQDGHAADRAVEAFFGSA